MTREPTAPRVHAEVKRHDVQEAQLKRGGDAGRHLSIMPSICLRMSCARRRERAWMKFS